MEIGFKIAAHANFLAVGDAAFDASGIVAGSGEGGEAGSRCVADFVVDRRAGSKSGGHAGADFDRLDGLQRHDRGGEQGVETFVPLRVGAEAGRNLMGDDLEDAAERIAGS